MFNCCGNRWVIRERFVWKVTKCWELKISLESIKKEKLYGWKCFAADNCRPWNTALSSFAELSDKRKESGVSVLSGAAAHCFGAFTSDFNVMPPTTPTPTNQISHDLGVTQSLKMWCRVTPPSGPAPPLPTHTHTSRLTFENVPGSPAIENVRYLTLSVLGDPPPANHVTFENLVRLQAIIFYFDVQNFWCWVTLLSYDIWNLVVTKHDTLKCDC